MFIFFNNHILTHILHHSKFRNKKNTKKKNKSQLTETTKIKETQEKQASLQAHIF